MTAPVAIVTGAGSGIGREVALLLAEEGWAQTIAGRRVDRLRETHEACARRGAADRVLVVAADLARPGAPREIVERTLDVWGRLDALVNNAAALVAAPLAATTPGLLAEVLAVNVHGPALLVAAAWPAFVRQGGGRVVNVSSMATVDPFPGLAVYAASKAALESLTRSIVREGRHSGVTAYTVVPGAVETEMLRRVVSTMELPLEAALEPRAVAGVIVECATGRRAGEGGPTIMVPSPGSR